MTAVRYVRIAARHAQFQAGAITFAELINSLIAAGVATGCLELLPDGELRDADETLQKDEK